MRASAVKSITYMKAHSAELVAEVNQKRGPVVITQNGLPLAVVMDIDSYQRVQDALILLKNDLSIGRRPPKRQGDHARSDGTRTPEEVR